MARSDRQICAHLQEGTTCYNDLQTPIPLDMLALNTEPALVQLTQSLHWCSLHASSRDPSLL